MGAGTDTPGETLDACENRLEVGGVLVEARLYLGADHGDVMGAA